MRRLDKTFKELNENEENGSEFDDIIEIYDDEDSDYNYRARGLENTSSNYGWYKCVKCNRSFRKGDMDIDHIIPKSKGGDSSRNNLQCICKHCNRSKQDDTSETDQDLERRRKELEQQDKEDKEFLKCVKEVLAKEKEFSRSKSHGAGKKDYFKHR